MRPVWHWASYSKKYVRCLVSAPFPCVCCVLTFTDASQLQEGSAQHLAEAARAFENAATLAQQARVENSPMGARESDALELLALALLKLGDEAGALRVVSNDELATANSSYIRALISGVNVARSASMGANVNVKDDSIREVLQWFVMFPQLRRRAECSRRHSTEDHLQQVHAGCRCRAFKR